MTCDHPDQGLPRQFDNRLQDREQAREHDRVDWANQSAETSMPGRADDPGSIAGPQPGGAPAGAPEMTQRGADSWNEIRGIAGQFQRPTRFQDGDAQTAEAVRGAIARILDAGAGDVCRVTVENGVAHLTGAVRDPRAREALLEASRETPGVTGVHADLRTEGPEPRSS